MLVKDFITKEIPVLKSFDTAEYALALMEDFKLKHLPLLSDNAYQCLVSEKDLLAMPDPSATIGEPVLFAPAISENGHLHEALAMITRYGLSLLPVVSGDGPYCVIVLEMMPQDYSLTDIARLVEANNAHVLNLLSHQDTDTGRLLITLKIDLEDASPVIRSFERFNYTVLYHFMEKGMVDDMLQQRMNELLHYMNM